jgi:hypothetical protein
METKFIEGTNEQYSIREDGAVIRHYLKKGHGNNQKPWIEYNNVELIYKKHPQRNCMSIIVRCNGKTLQFFKNSLLSKYFNIIICPQCENIINVEKHERVCKKCINFNNKQLQKKLRLKNPVLYQSFQKKHYENNKEKRQIYSKNLQKIKRQVISRDYVASKLEIPVSLLTDDFYENYKATLLVKRKLAEKLNTKPTYL